MLLLGGTIATEVSQLLARLGEETLPCDITLYQDWQKIHSDCSSHDHAHPEGIIHLHIAPEIAKKRLEQSNSLELAHKEPIEQAYTEKELQHLPILVLNGNIDFQTDFAQFYNHLFYIRRLIKQIQEKKELALGIHKEKTPQRRCC